MMKRSLLVFVVLGFTFQVFAQEKDFRTWWSAEFSTELYDKVDISVVPEVRFIENSSMYAAFLTEVDASVPVTNYFRTGIKYRFEQIQSEEMYIGQRFSVFGRLRANPGKFTLDYRLVFQREYIGMQTRENGKEPDDMLRHRFSASYSKKKWKIEPEVSLEIFDQLGYGSLAYAEKLRASAGVNYKVNKKLSLSLDFKYQQEFYQNNPLQAYILSTSISYRL
ncbi:MAG: DUF2490 domain-containing protein [Bacteroidota bacterium]|nr:MAG: DUF2490 domain-containing protein [Bacteroidota bacterium]